MLFSLGSIYKSFWPWFTTLGVTILLFFGMTLLPHLKTFGALRRARIGGSISWSFLGVITSNTTTVSLISIVILGLLMGVYIVVLITYIRKFRITSSSLKGFGGSILGLFGVGCAACGSLIFTPLLTIVGATSLLAILPFGGKEFLYLGIIILGLSIRSLLKKIYRGAVCSVAPVLDNNS